MVDTGILHSEKCNMFTVRKTCGKLTFNAWFEKHAFYHPLNSLMLAYYNPCIEIVFLETFS